MKKLIIASFSSLLTLMAFTSLVLIHCAGMGVNLAEDFDPANLTTVHKKIIGVSGGTGFIAPPAISPEMNQKLTVSMGGAELHLQSLDESDKRTVYAAGGGGVISPNIIDISWSPDGNWVALLVYRPSSTDASYLLMDTESFETRTLLEFSPPYAESGSSEQQSENVVYNCGVSWKSNDTVLLSAFLQNAENYELVELNIFSGDRAVIQENDAVKAYFSPDGEKVAFFRPGGEYEGSWYSSQSSLESYFKTLDLYIGDADFSDAEKLAEGIHENKRVSWSRDGRYLAFVQDGKKSITGTSNTLKYYDTTGNTVKEIGTAKFLNAPAFSADNEIYFFVSSNFTYKAKIQ